MEKIHLEIRGQQAERTNWIKILNGFDETITTKGLVWAVGILDRDGGTGVEPLDCHHTRGVLVLVANGDRLKRKRKTEMVKYSSRKN